MSYKKSDFLDVNFEVKVFKERAIPLKFSEFEIFGKKNINCFELFNNGCNIDIGVGKGRFFYPIPFGQGKTFGLDGKLKWSALQDKELKLIPSKFKLTDCDNKALPEQAELILIYYEILFC